MAVFRSGALRGVRGVQLVVCIVDRVEVLVRRCGQALAAADRVAMHVGQHVDQLRCQQARFARRPLAPVVRGLVRSQPVDRWRNGSRAEECNWWCA